jgi:hypothetical protein
MISKERWSWNWSRRNNVKRRVLSALVFGASVYLILVAGSAVPSYFRTVPVTPQGLSSAQVQRELGSRLSSTTTIIGPKSPDFADAIARWSDFGEPTVQVVVEPGDESDVSTIVCALPTLTCELWGIDIVSRSNIAFKIPLSFWRTVEVMGLHTVSNPSMVF